MKMETTTNQQHHTIKIKLNKTKTTNNNRKTNQTHET